MYHPPLKNVPFANLSQMKNWPMVHFLYIYTPACPPYPVVLWGWDMGVVSPKTPEKPIFLKLSLRLRLRITVWESSVPGCLTSVRSLSSGHRVKDLRKKHGENFPDDHKIPSRVQLVERRLPEE